jgi:HEAT repeat protein
MKRITLAMLLAVAVTALSTAASAKAQDPTPPPARATRPAPAAQPGPAPRPAIAPRAIIDPNFDFDALRFDAADMVDAQAVREATRAALEQGRAMIDATRETTMAAMADARAGAELARGFAPFAAMEPLPAMRPMPAMAPLAAMPHELFSMDAARGEGFSFHSPPAPWAQGDPADSVYRVARDALNRGDYGLAAKMFAAIPQKFPKSAYVANAQYYEAYARYRIGTSEELQQASKVLEPLTLKVVNVSNNGTPSSRALFEADRRGGGNNDVAALYARINGVLAQRGDRGAAEKVAKVAALNGSAVCDNEDIQVRVAAMNALSQMDPSAAMPILKRVLDRKDDCSSELRSRAVFMLGRRADTESAQLLIAAAKSDPSMNVRTEAINALPRLQGDIGLSTLEDILRTEQDERIQRAAVRSLASSDNAKARSSMRALIDRKDAPVNLRVEAISSLNSDRATTEDAAYLRGLYANADNDRVKDAIISAVSRMGGADNDKWVLAIAQNQSEPSQLRSAAIARLVRSNISIADLSKLYDTAESSNIRQQIVNVLANRKEPEATDKLIDIVKNSTVITVRTQAINALVRKNDPRGVKLLNDILDGKAP